MPTRSKRLTTLRVVGQGHLVEFGSHKPCRNIVSCDRYEWLSLLTSHHPAEDSGHSPHGSRNIFCHVIERTYEFVVSGSIL